MYHFIMQQKLYLHIKSNKQESPTFTIISSLALGSVLKWAISGLKPVGILLYIS